MWQVPWRWIRGLARGAQELFDWLLGPIFAVPVRSDGTRPWYGRWWAAPFAVVLLLPYRLLVALSSVMTWFGSWGSLASTRGLYFRRGLPALALMLTIASALTWGVSLQGAVEQDYRDRMKRALAAQKPQLACELGRRLMLRGDASSEIKMLFGEALLGTDDREWGERLWLELAPDDRAGYPPAHRRRALALAAEMGSKLTAEGLQRLRWHLEHSGTDPDVMVEQLWASYFQTVGLPEQSIRHMETAVKIDPRLMWQLANLYRGAKNLAAENRVLRESEVYLVKAVQATPDDRELRILLAMTLVRLSKIDEAERVMLEGLARFDLPEMRRSACEFYLMRFDQTLLQQPSAHARQLEFVLKALELDDAFVEVYNRCVLLYERSPKSESADALRTRLLERCEGDRSPALAHFALSSFYLVDRDATTAEQHLWQSNRLDGGLAVVSNNLAWILAHHDQPDLEKSMELALEAVKAAPNEPRFIDTYATVLLKQGRFDQAITQFESILPFVPDKRSVHRKLADAYRQAGQLSLAQRHQEMSKSASALP